MVIEAETVSIHCPGEYTITAGFHQQPGAREVVLAMPESRSSAATNAELMGWLAAQTGMSFLVPDIRGFGASAEQLPNTTPHQHVGETTASYDWLKERFPNRTVHATGLSYGGLMVAMACRFRRVDSMLLRAPTIYRPEDLCSKQDDIDRRVLTMAYRKDVGALRRHPVFNWGDNGPRRTAVFVHKQDDRIPPETTDIYAEQFGAEVYGYDVKHVFPVMDDNPIFETYRADMVNWLAGK